MKPSSLQPALHLSYLGNWLVTEQHLSPEVTGTPDKPGDEGKELA